MERRYAHSLEGKPPESWQPLGVHLENVAARAARFAASFGSAEWGRVLGMLHDVGKARASFQRYLKRSNGLSDESYDGADHSHSGAGAVWAVQFFQKAMIGRIFAYSIAGHHAGLPDWIGGVTPGGSLSCRLEQEKEVLEEPAVAEWIGTLPSFMTPPGPWTFANADVSF